MVHNILHNFVDAGSQVLFDFFVEIRMTPDEFNDRVRRAKRYLVQNARWNGLRLGVVLGRQWPKSCVVLQRGTAAEIDESRRARRQDQFTRATASVIPAMLRR